MNYTEIVEIPEKGVGYYNIDNKENKDKKDNMQNSFPSSSSGLVADATQNSLCPQDLSSSQEREAEPQSSVLVGAPTPLDMNQVKGFIVQLFDNGETAYQRHKLKLRLNLLDNSNPEFIASLTKDIRNFKKYIPEPNRNEIIAIATEERKRIRKEFGVYPYIGKFHLNSGFKNNATNKQIEPDTLAIVWWDAENRGWSGIFKIQNFAREFDLFDQYLTAKQKAQGVKAQDTWRNPKFDKTPRPLTWAQQRGQQ